MRVLKIIGKVILFPVMILGIFLQWIGTLVIALSSTIIRIVAGILLVITGVSFFLGILSGTEVLRIGAIEIAVLCLPFIGKAGLVLVTVINEKIRDSFYS